MCDGDHTGQSAGAIVVVPSLDGFALVAGRVKPLCSVPGVDHAEVEPGSPGAGRVGVLELHGVVVAGAGVLAPHLPADPHVGIVGEGVR